jgi:hypothetical protein
MRSAVSAAALTVVLSFGMAASARAQGLGPTPGATAGTPRAIENAAPAAENVAIGTVNPSRIITNASVATGAVGLRNRIDGGIEVSGVTGPIKVAYLYWAVITQGPPTAAVTSVYLKKGAANGPFTNIVGTRIATGQTPCWFTGDRTTVYRAAVPLSLANGNGLYVVLLRPGASGSTGGASPWVSSIPPLFEGISLVIVGTGTSRVSIYDFGFAGRMFYDVLTYRLATASVAGATEVVIHNIGADGQIGVDVNALPAASGEITYLNGRRIAGPGSPAIKSDWNGSVAEPLPQLWDNTTHTVTSQALAGANPTLLPFQISAPDDCLVTVANILSVR